MKPSYEELAASVEQIRNALGEVKPWRHERGFVCIWENQYERFMTTVGDALATTPAHAGERMRALERIAHQIVKQATLCDYGRVGDSCVAHGLLNALEEALEKGASE